MNVLKQTKSVVERKDLSKIAEIAGLSESTLVKWWNEDLKVKPETEQRILEASIRYADSKKEVLVDNIKFMEALENRIKSIKTNHKKALSILK